jgi:hypothetical protein
MAHRFDVRRPRLRPQSRLQPIAGGLLADARFREVVGDQFRLCFDDLGKFCFHHFGNPMMEGLPLVLDQRAISRVLARA